MLGTHTAYAESVNVHLEEKNMNPFNIYRILHFTNLGYILQNGIITSPNHPNSNPNYRSIGNNDIIQIRSNKNVSTHPDNTFRDFIGFYIGKRSIMLYNIITGYGEIQRVNQDEIIYLVYNISQINNHGYDYFFTDGHALKAPITQFYSDLADFHNVDLTAVNATNFSAAAEINYPDLKRKKQSEFHILNEIDFNNIIEIVVLTNQRQQEIQQLIQQYGYTTNVRVDNDYYFV